MVVGTLYKSCEANEPIRTRAILPASLVKYYKLDVALSDPDEHFPSEYPARLVPAFRYASGRLLTESIPITLMLTSLIPENGSLLGDNTEADKGLVLSWLNVLNIELMNSIATRFTMVVGRQPYDRAVYDAAGKTMDRAVKILEQHLTKNTYLVAEQVSLADLYGVPMLLRALQHLWGPEYRAQYPAVMRWFNTISKLPVFDGHFDSLELTSVSKNPEQH